MASRVGLLFFGLLFFPTALSAQDLPLAVSGTASFRNGTPVAVRDIRFQFFLGGTNLFEEGQNGCGKGDAHRSALLRTERISDPSGAFSFDFLLSQATAVTDPDCSLSPNRISQVSSIRLDASVVADSAACVAYCGTAGEDCIQNCASDHRTLQASRTLTQAEVDQLLASAASGSAMNLKVSIVFDALGPPVSSAPGVDLQVSGEDIRGSVEFSEESFGPSDCARIEGCVSGPGSRKLLRFDGNFFNSGNESLVVGNPSENPEFEYSACHDHHHLKDMMLYQLVDVGTGAAVSGEGGVVVGRKQGFCVADIVPVTELAPREAFFDCQEQQGLSPGWKDTYDRWLDCQFLDVTGVQPGQYLLRVTVNPDGIFVESNTQNNSVDVPVTVK